MKLNILDRMVIPAVILPKQGKMVEMMISDSISEAIKFTPEQISQYNLKDSESGTTWDPKDDQEIEYTFTSEQVKCLKDSVNKLDEAGLITKDTFKTCQKILATTARNEKFL